MTLRKGRDQDGCGSDNNSYVCFDNSAGIADWNRTVEQNGLNPIKSNIYQMTG